MQKIDLNEETVQMWSTLSVTRFGDFEVLSNKFSNKEGKMFGDILDNFENHNI